MLYIFVDLHTLSQMFPEMFEIIEISYFNQCSGVIASSVNNVIPAWKRQINNFFSVIIQIYLRE